MQAEWKIKGIYKADAQKVADEIGDGKVTPQEVLEKARDENSELHHLLGQPEKGGCSHYPGVPLQVPQGVL